MSSHQNASPTAWISSAKKQKRAGRKITEFGTCIQIFCTLGESVEAAHAVAGKFLSKRYATDMTDAAKRYGALGRPADAAAKSASTSKPAPATSESTPSRTHQNARPNWNSSPRK